MPHKLMVVVGTRPEAIKLFPLIHALRRTSLDVRICATGQHRELLDQMLRFAGIAPDIDLNVMQPGQSLDTLTARLLVAIGETMDVEQPDRVVVQGDTASAMAAALAAYHRLVPVSHVEAGLRSGDLSRPHPEEGNRRIISALADQHFAPTKADAEALWREGVDEAAIHVTGNTVVDALLATRDRIAADPSLAAALDPIVERFEGRRIIAVTTHRRESRGGAMAEIASALKRLAARPDIAIILPVHPAAEVREALTQALDGLPNVALVEPLDYPCFVHLLDRSHLILTDSGGIQEEAPALGKPVLVMRDTTERPQAIEAGTAKLVGTSAENVVAEATRLLDDPAAYAAMAKAHSPFGDGRAAERIAELIEWVMKAKTRRRDGYFRAESTAAYASISGRWLRYPARDAPGGPCAVGPASNAHHAIAEALVVIERDFDQSKTAARCEDRVREGGRHAVALVIEIRPWRPPPATVGPEILALIVLRTRRQIVKLLGVKSKALHIFYCEFRGRERPSGSLHFGGIDSLLAADGCHVRRL